MNWLLILVAALIIGNAFWGYKKGFMRTVFSLVSWVVVLAVSYFGAPIVADVLVESTDIEIAIQENLTNAISEAFVNSGAGEIEAALPAELKSALLGENSEGALTANAAEMLVTSTGIANTIIALIAAVIIAIIARLVVAVIDMVLGLASKMPLIGSTDKLLGIAFGGLKGLVWCWLVLAAIAILTLTGTNAELISMVQESSVLTWLYDNNIIVNMLMKSI